MVTNIKMKALISSILFILVCYPLYSQKARPLLTVIHCNHDARFLTSDLPEFVLYENGLVIYKKVSSVSIYDTTLMCVNLQKKEVDLIMDKMSLVFQNSSIDTFQNKSYVYGDLAILNAWDKNNNYKHYKAIFDIFPEKKGIYYVFEMMYNFAIEYENKDAIKWKPQKVEVLLVKYKETKRKKNNYPDFFPSLSSKEVEKRNEALYSFFIDKSHLNELYTISKKRIFHNKVIYEIQLRTYIPSEKYWRPFFE